MISDLLAWQSYIEEIHPDLIDYSIINTQKLASSLGLLEQPSKVIVVGGTNGKGTTCALLEKILTDNGHRVGKYTSPHLLSVRERVRLNATNVDESTLIKAFEFIDHARGDIKLTYFEFLTLSAFYIFKQQPLDFIILEIGLGGRLDTVNIMDSDVSIITSIGIDHVEYLGQDREAIGFEKAGIYKNGSIAILGDNNPPQTVLDHIKEKQIVFSRIDEHFNITKKSQRYAWESEPLLVSNLQLPNIEPSNLACVLECLKQLGLNDCLQTHLLNSSLQAFNLLGRFSVRQKGCSIILDIAHNPDAICSLGNKLKSITSKKKIAVFSMSKDKDITKAISQLSNYFDHWYIIILEDKRGASLPQYQQTMQLLDMKNYTITYSLKELINDLETELLIDDQIVIFGSFKIVAEYLSLEIEETSNIVVQ